MKPAHISAQLQFMVTNAGNNIHSRIRQARLAVGLNQSALAAKLSIKPQSVQNWEKGRSSPKSKRLEDLARILEVSPAWLLSGQKEQALSTLSITQEEQLLIKQFRKMSPIRQKILTEITQSLAENS